MFGIGTNYTNEFMRKSSGGKERSPALNVVIKLAQVGGKPCVKISDELSKVRYVSPAGLSSQSY